MKLTPLLALLPLFSLTGLAEVQWDVTTAATIVAKSGDPVVAFALVRETSNQVPTVNRWGSKNHLRVGGVDYTLYIGNDDSEWRGIGGLQLAVLVNETTGLATPYNAYQTFDYVLHLALPQLAKLPSEPTLLSQAYTLEISSPPTSIGEVKPITVTDVLHGLTYTGQWTVQALRGDLTDPSFNTSSWTWTKDGQPYALPRTWATGMDNAGMLYIPSFTPARDAGVYVATYRNPTSGATLSWTTTLKDSAAVVQSRLVNVSVRIGAGTGEQTLIAGFVVSGTGSGKSLLVRGLGPTLATLGVSGELANPTLELYDMTNHATVARNDDWGALGNVADVITTGARVGAYPMVSSTSRDAALLRSVPRGVYSALVSGGTGIAMVEVYDADEANSSSRLVNISARALSGTGDNVLIAGFVITGETAKSVMIRGVGPDLTAGGVTNPLADPKLELYRLRVGQTAVLVNTNDDWGNLSSMVTTAQRVGAQPLTSAKDAVILATLQPGVYTAMVKGVNDTTGVALVEIYDAD